MKNGLKNKNEFFKNYLTNKTQDSMKTLKQITLIVLLVFCGSQSFSQKVKFLSTGDKNTEVTIQKPLVKTSVGLKNPKNSILNVNYTEWKLDSTKAGDSTIRRNDTTEIKIGKTRIVVIGDSKVDKIYTDEDSTDFNKNSISIGKKSNKYEKSYFGVDFGFTSYLDDGSFSLSNPNKDLGLKAAKSSHFAFVYHKKINLINKQLNFIPGIGFSWYNYRFKRDITPITDTTNFSWKPEGSLNFSKNKLTATYLEVPLLLQFQAKSNKSNKEGFRIAAGMEFGYLLGGKSKQKSDANGKQKQRDDFNLQQFRYGAVARIAYHGFSIYGKYALNNLFDDSDPIKLTPVSFGISFGSF